MALAADPQASERISAAIVEAGGEPVRVEGLDGIGNAVIPHRFVVFAWDGAEEPLKELSRRLRPGTQVVAVVPPVELKRMTRLLADEACNHVVTDGEAGMRWLAVTVGKYVSGDLFGIEKYLPANTDIRLTRLRDYQGRTRAIDEVLRYAEELGVRSKVRSQIGQVCEELLMNALYDAPVDEEGNVLFAEVDLKERLERLSPRPVSIRYAATESGFAVSVRDRFGRLDKSTILRYLEKCLNSQSQIDRKIYGAGLGLYFIVNSASHVVVNIAPGMATEVVCTFERKGVRTGLRSFSMFVYPGETTAATQQAPQQQSQSS